MTPRARVAFGAVIAALGAMTVLVIYLHPEKLRAPLRVGLAASSSFGIAGIAVALHPFISARSYRWSMIVLLAVMASIPAWIAFGPGVRTCHSNIPFFTGEYGCRVAFGIGAVLMLLMLGAAISQAFRRQ